MNRSKKRNRFQEIKNASFLLPSFTGFMVLSIIPIVLTFVISFTSWSGLHKLELFSAAFWRENFIGLQNYKDILTSGELLRILKNTVYFIVLYIPLMLTGSLLIASLLNRPYKGAKIFAVLYYIPVLTSWIAGALIWKWVLSPEYGAINNLLALIGIQGPGWLQDSKWAMPGIVLASVWKDVGFYGLILLGGLKGINKTYYEASKIDGATKMKTFFRITLPLLTPYIFFVLIISMINAFQIFPQVMIMTKDAGPNGATQVFVERIYKYGFRYYEMGYATALSWILFIIIFIFTSVQQKLEKRWVHYEQ